MVATAGKNQCEVVLVGCGAPSRGMGWYHAEQMLKNKCPSAKLCYIVEGWFLGAGANGPGGPEFTTWKDQTEANHGVQFLMSLADVPPPETKRLALISGRTADNPHLLSEAIKVCSLADLPPPETKRLALISGRTADNPHLLSEAIKHGCTCIYLEKPGAPTVTELESMREEAKGANVAVCMGYNKNVCKYVSKAREYATEHGGHITFVSNNTYENTPESLGECFERNAEGMLKNMAIHELALLVTFFDVTVENIESVTADKEFSSCQTLTGPSGKEFTDFDRIKFTIKTKTGKAVSVQADRCGGDVSYAKVTDDESGIEVFRHSMPDDEDKANVTVLEHEYPGAMPYFFSQDPDYITVKERVSNFCANGVEATGVATIDIAVETLRVAEYLTPTLKEQLKRTTQINTNKNLHGL